MTAIHICEGSDQKESIGKISSRYCRRRVGLFYSLSAVCTITLLTKANSYCSAYTYQCLYHPKLGMAEPLTTPAFRWGRLQTVDVQTYGSIGNVEQRVRPRRNPSTRMAADFSSGSYGLTDDGDFAILGINVDDDDEGSNGESSLLSGASFLGSLLDSKRTVQTPFGFGNLDDNNDLFAADALSGDFEMNTVNILEKDTNHLTSLASREEVPIRVAPNDEQQMGEELSLQQWVLEVIPTLCEKDAAVYARGLSQIGFHPQCVTQCELKWEDLHFMKLLHRRYLFHEVTGEGHPWEA